jgi:hypothetical protein
VNINKKLSNKKDQNNNTNWCILSYFCVTGQSYCNLLCSFFHCLPLFAFFVAVMHVKKSIELLLTILILTCTDNSNGP